MGTDRTRPTTEQAEARLLADIAGAKASPTPGPWYAYSPLASGVHAGHHYKVANSQPVGVCEDEDGSIVPHFPEWNANSRVVCTTTDDEHSRDNARLIAAAPDLLAACKEAEMLAAHGIGAVNTSNDPDCKANAERNLNECIRIQKLIRAAIAKAEGNPTT